MLHISGNVFLTEGKMQLQTDEIIYDRAQNIAYYNTGGVLREDQTTLSSKMGFYNASSKRFVFRDSVRLSNPKYKIVADTLEYGSESKIAYFFGPTNIISDSTTIYCEKGTFSTISEIANLTRNAIVIKKAQTIKGDSIHYRVKDGYGDITGNAYISDTINKYVISGGRAKYRERPEFALVTDHPLYALNIEDDTLYITGDTLRITSVMSERKVRVYRHAKFFKSDFQGKCDSLIYTETDSIFYLYNEPVVWNAENQLTADFIFLTTVKGNLDSLHMIGNAFLIAREDSTKYNQIKGRDMFGKFYENELRKIFVKGNGQTVYYAYDENQKMIGVNRADCSNLIIRIENSEVKRVTFLTKPNATLYPPGQIPKGELFLKGFRARFVEQVKNKNELIKR
jgi:lipopolysaccharide export system protein LptA